MTIEEGSGTTLATEIVSPVVPWVQSVTAPASRFVPNAVATVRPVNVMVVTGVKVPGVAPKTVSHIQ